MIQLFRKHNRGKGIKRKGFTLVELLIVMLILAVIAGIATPVYLNQKSRAQRSIAESAGRAMLSNFTSQLLGVTSFGTTNGTIVVNATVTPATVTITLGSGATSPAVFTEALTAGVTASGVTYANTTQWCLAVVKEGQTVIFTDAGFTNTQTSCGLTPGVNAGPVSLAPTIGTATAISSTTATVAFTAPVPNGAATIIDYTATSSPGDITTVLTQAGSGTFNITGLTMTTAYTFTIRARNSAGYSIASAASNSITTPSPYAIVTGGILSSDATYYYRTFTSNGTLTITTASLTVDYLLVAGGGASGWYQNANGGGGAGGVRGFTSQSLVPASYSAVVGAGGTVATVVATPGGKGGNSSFNSTSATGGGGGGGGYASTAGNATIGGSGGGGWGIDGAMYGNVGAAGNQGGYSPVEGYSGGNPRPEDGAVSAGGGGGGAGGVGASAGSNGGVGGVGTATYSSWGLATTTGHNVGGTVYYGGGGGGGKDSRSAGTIGAGGSGGGGNAGTTNTAGMANTGGGGGAGGVGTGGSTAGGSGIVIIRYTKVSVGG